MLSICVHFKSPTAVVPTALCESKDGRLTSSGHVTCASCRAFMRDLGVQCDPENESITRQTLMTQIAVVARRADHLHDAIIDLNAQDTNMTLDEVSAAARKIRALTAEILLMIEGTARAAERNASAR